MMLFVTCLLLAAPKALALVCAEMDSEIAYV